MSRLTMERKMNIFLNYQVELITRNKKYTLYNQVVKGYNKGEIFTNPKIVEKLVNKIKGRRSKQKLVPLNLTLISQHGYGVEEN